MANKSKFKLKITDNRHDDELTVTLTEPTRYAEQIGDMLFDFNPCKECRLIVIGDPDSTVHLETIFNLCAALSKLFDIVPIWDITPEPPKEGEPKDLNGYLILN